MLRDDFDNILKEYGYNILLVREKSKIQCSCWNEKTQESPRDCPVCFGMGRVPIIEKHTVRSQVMSIPPTLSRAVDSSSPPGSMLAGSMGYFMRYNVPVRVGDLIIEVEWSSTGKPIYDGGEVNEVNFIDSKRFAGGEITYKIVYTQDKPVAKEIRGIRIANSNGIKNYEIISKG